MVNVYEYDLILLGVTGIVKYKKTALYQSSPKANPVQGVAGALRSAPAVVMIKKERSTSLERPGFWKGNQETWG